MAKKKAKKKAAPKAPKRKAAPKAAPKATTKRRRAAPLGAAARRAYVAGFKAGAGKKTKRRPSKRKARR